MAAPVTIDRLDRVWAMGVDSALDVIRTGWTMRAAACESPTCRRTLRTEISTTSLDNAVGYDECTEMVLKCELGAPKHLDHTQFPNALYLARDKRTGKAKGFAYVTYESKRDAEKAIRMLNKYTYDYLVLSVEWSKSDKDK